MKALWNNDRLWLIASGINFGLAVHEAGWKMAFDIVLGLILATAHYDLPHSRVTRVWRNR